MTAKIMKSPDNTITATDNQRPFTNEVKSDEITGFSDVTDMTCQLPVVAEKRITFERIQFGVGITPAGQPSRPCGIRAFSVTCLIFVRLSEKGR